MAGPGSWLDWSAGREEGVQQSRANGPNSWEGRRWASAVPVVPRFVLHTKLYKTGSAHLNLYSNAETLSLVAEEGL